MLRMVTRSPWIVASASLATSGCQSRSFDGRMVLHQLPNSATTTANTSTARQRQLRKRSETMVSSAARATATASTERRVGPPGPAKYTIPAPQREVPRMSAPTITRSRTPAIRRTTPFPRLARSDVADSFSLCLDPRLGTIEHSEVASDLQLAVFHPELRLVDLAVLGIQNRAALVTIPARAQILDDDKPDDGLVLIFALTRRAGLRLALLVIRFAQAGDLGEDLPALIVHFDGGTDLAGLLVDGAPLADGARTATTSNDVILVIDRSSIPRGDA